MLCEEEPTVPTLETIEDLSYPHKDLDDPECACAYGDETESTLSSHGDESESSSSSSSSDYEGSIITEVDENGQPVEPKKTWEAQPWQHAMYHITTSILSASTASTLPHAFAYLSFSGGTVLFLAIAAATYYASALIIRLQEKDHKSYSDIGNYLMDNREWMRDGGFSRYCVRPLQALDFFLGSVMDVLITGKSLRAVQLIVVTAMSSSSLSETDDGAAGAEDTAAMAIEDHVLPLRAWILIAGAVFFVLALIPSITQSWKVSLCGTVAGVASAILLLVGCVFAAMSRHGDETDMEQFYSRPPPRGDIPPTLSYTFGVLKSFGAIMLAFGGQSVLPDLQTALHSETAAQGHQFMMKGLTGGYSVIMPFYLACGVVGYLAFGSEVSSFILDDMAPYVPDAFLVVVYVLLIVNQLALGSIFMQAMFSLICDIFPTIRNKDHGHQALCHLKELSVRLAYVAFVTFLADAIPFFGDVASLTGSFVTPLTFVFPFLFWNRSALANLWGKWRKHVNRIMMVLFTCIGICAMTGALFFIVVERINYTEGFY